MRKQLIPDTPFTKCPKLDPTIQSRLPKPAKDADHNLVRLQTLLLNATAPLRGDKNGSLTPKSAAESAQLALKLLGNASANISTERRRKATTHLNPEVGTLIEDEGTFRDAALFLFGRTFDQQARDHNMEAMKSLKEITFTSSRQSFQRGHPSASWGGGTFRGRGTIKKFSAPQRGKKLNEFCMYKTFDENVKHYKYLQRKRVSLHDTHYRDSVIKQGVNILPITSIETTQHRDYTACVRQHTDSSGVRDYTK